MAQRAMPELLALISEPGWPNPQRSASDTRLLPGRAIRVELVEDVRDVALDGVQAQVERTRDQLIAVARRDARQHFDLARRQPLGSCFNDGQSRTLRRDRCNVLGRTYE